ncbi:MAG: betaine--homocysteine S-methyltransferase [Ancalomicrobiaceae bacterium]|nr:betaine--homocysteine S-methyltransferase [Ancalomicrobiaceae bacterium]
MSEPNASQNALEALLASRPVLLADGATGTNLFAMGLTSGDSPELWNVEQPEKIRALAESFVAAGSDIILTNTFGCNARRLMLHKLESRVRELNMAAVAIARSVANDAGRPVIVAGSVGPTGDLFAPLGALTEVEAVAVFAEQMRAMKEAGVDVAWIETMSAPEEMRAAVTAAEEVGLPFVLTASFDTAGRTMMGMTPPALGDLAETFADKPIAIGANCGVGASDLLVSVRSILETHPDAIVVAKANCGVPRFVAEEVVYSGTPELMADYARLAIDVGVRIVGGCCGNAPGHVAAMRHAIDTHQRGDRPSVATIIERLGPLVSPPADTTEPRERKSRRRG